jgi:hypothetical protein
MLSGTRPSPVLCRCRVGWEFAWLGAILTAMNVKAEQLFNEALTLPDSERVALAERLLECCGADAVPTRHDLRALQSLIDQGDREIQAGEHVPAEDVLREIGAI